MNVGGLEFDPDLRWCVLAAPSVVGWRENRLDGGLPTLTGMGHAVEVCEVSDDSPSPVHTKG